MRSILDQRAYQGCSPPLEPDKRQLAEIEGSGLIPCCCRKAVENGGTVQRLILRPHPYPILTVLGRGLLNVLVKRRNGGSVHYDGGRGFVRAVEDAVFA